MFREHTTEEIMEMIDKDINEKCQKNVDEEKKVPSTVYAKNIVFGNVGFINFREKIINYLASKNFESYTIRDMQLIELLFKYK